MAEAVCKYQYMGGWRMHGMRFKCKAVYGWS